MFLTATLLKVHLYRPLYLHGHIYLHGTLSLLYGSFTPTQDLMLPYKAFSPP